MIIKLIEPIGFENNEWIKAFNKEFDVEIEVLDTRGLSDERLLPLIQDANALILSNRPLSNNVLKKCLKLQFISVAFTGIDHIGAADLAERKIILKNAAGYATHAVAELTLALTLELYRNIHVASHSITQEKGAFFPPGRELFGKKIGVIGGGLIGNEVARLFTAFGCIVSIYKREAANLREILTTSDILTLHLPLKPETRHFINQERLSLMKKEAVIINTARGPLIDEQALIKALENKEIQGAALDVFDIEPPLPKNHPLLKMANVICTPHIGYRTQEAIHEKAYMAINHLKEWIKNL